jgi:ribose transport system ATP-binding protein
MPAAALPGSRSAPAGGRHEIDLEQDGFDEAMADLELHRVSKRFGGVQALDEANLECFRGEVHGLVGENGAGKSTLVKILVAAVQRDAGEIILDSLPRNLRRPSEAIGARIGMVFQELSLLPDLTVAQNIFFGHEPLGPGGVVTGRRLSAHCFELYERMGTEVADPNQVVRELSLARRQMVEIAKVVSRDPEVIVFDEASSALGREDVEWLLDFSRRLADRGKIVIYISHKLSEILQVSDRITVYRNGRDVGVRERGTATTEELVGLMLGHRIDRLYPAQKAPAQREIVLEVRNLDSGPKLRGVSFVLRRGEILGIGGLTGQGQNELFRALFGIDRAGGQLLVDGKPVMIRSPRDALERSIGLALVPEDRATQGLLLPKSLVHNVSLSVLPSVLRFGLIQREREKQLALSAVERLAIKVSSVDSPVQQLSGGNQQKVVLAKLLATAPKVLMMHDSTRGVDMGTKAEIYQLLRDLTASGSSVLLYSTDNGELINMCDRILVLRQGRVQAEIGGDTMSETNLVRASLGEEVVATPPAEERELLSHQKRVGP